MALSLRSMSCWRSKGLVRRLWKRIATESASTRHPYPEKKPVHDRLFCFRWARDTMLHHKLSGVGRAFNATFARICRYRSDGAPDGSTPACGRLFLECLESLGGEMCCVGR